MKNRKQKEPGGIRKATGGWGGWVGRVSNGVN